MSLKKSLEVMARYNQWMNINLFDVLDGVNDRELNTDRGAFFGSILGTLNHILVADVIWLKRFIQHGNYGALDELRSWRQPNELGDTLYQDIDGLKRARAQMDMMLIGLTNEMSETELSGAMGYHDMAGVAHRKHIGHLLMHVFNHQTHHRGQVTTLLSQLGIDPGVTDLGAMLPEV
tara:strand:+ start:1839 stop:2369 length:531 start_codon:yes stop_codon:yes gene_type:complete